MDDLVSRSELRRVLVPLKDELREQNRVIRLLKLGTEKLVHATQVNDIRMKNLEREIASKDDKIQELLAASLEKDSLLQIVRADNARKAVEIDRLKLEICDGPLCVICMGNKCNVVVWPCSHVCACEHCMTTMMRREGPLRCPCCRSPISSYQKVHVL